MLVVVLLTRRGEKMLVVVLGTVAGGELCWWSLCSGRDGSEVGGGKGGMADVVV